VLLGQDWITLLQSVVRHFAQDHSTFMKLTVHRLISAKRICSGRKRQSASLTARTKHNNEVQETARPFPASAGCRAAETTS
jgi:hypothetical protein